ncbi:MAG: hypothetical protein ACHQAY_10400 [Hyphomicrobiales bacterium]
MLLPAGLAVALAGWNIYVAGHAHGVVAGTVLHLDGSPASGAIVILYERNLTSRFLEKARATTDAEGAFRFADNRSHQIRLDAIGADGQQGQPRILRLWFAAQDVRLRKALLLPAPKS